MSTVTLNSSSTLIKVLPRLLPAVLPVLVLIILLFFAINAPGFLSWGNLSSLVLNNFVLLAIVAVGMTWAVAAGGIDLSVGTALDFASLGFVVALNGGYGLTAAIAIALLAGVAAGAFNAMLIAGLRISPFLATLGTLFIGTSVQQLLSDGGQPIYIAQNALPGISSVLILGVPLPLVAVVVLAGVYGLVLARGRLGREILAVGTQPQLAYYSGLSTRRVAVWVFLGSALACGTTPTCRPPSSTPCSTSAGAIMRMLICTPGPRSLRRDSAWVMRMWGRVTRLSVRPMFSSPRRFWCRPLTSVRKLSSALSSCSDD
ncbi:hypothetical protein ALP75_200576 [Pseudomonas syringae pv. actinidiae]|nr:hypothetical protein ALP75_200576 [Pseudomonas syringae pv. actinidiae]